MARPSRHQEAFPELEPVFGCHSDGGAGLPETTPSHSGFGTSGQVSLKRGLGRSRVACLADGRRYPNPDIQGQWEAMLKGIPGLANGFHQRWLLDPQLLLDLLQRHAVGLGHDQQHPEQLPDHGQGVESEGVPAGPSAIMGKVHEIAAAIVQCVKLPSA